MKITGFRVQQYLMRMDRAVGDANLPEGVDLMPGSILYLDTDEGIVGIALGYGGASVLSFAADVRLALSSARIAPMGADATAELVELDTAASDSVWPAAASGYIDRVVRPEHARRELAVTLRALTSAAPGSRAGR